MDWITLVLADVFFTARRSKDGFWFGVSAFRGEEHEFRMMKDEEISAILYLSISGNDDPNNAVSVAMYKIAEAVCEDWPKNCRPFP